MTSKTSQFIDEFNGNNLKYTKTETVKLIPGIDGHFEFIIKYNLC